MQKSNLSVYLSISILTLITGILIFSSLLAQSEKLKPFTTDGCSVFPDGSLFQQTLWQQCCTAHDVAYWQGGTYQQRLDADLELESCVAKVGEPEIAKLMLAGVRVGGSPYWPTSFRWGYGWKYPKVYNSLSNDELTQIVSYELGLPGIEDFQFKLSSEKTIFVKYMIIKNIEDKDEYIDELNYFVDEFKKPLISNPIIATKDNAHIQKGLTFVYFVSLEELYSEQKSHINNAELIWNRLKPIVEKNNLKLTQIKTVAFTERDSNGNKKRAYATLSSEYLKNKNNKWRKTIKQH